MITIKETVVQVLCGTDIDEAVADALRLATQTNAPVKFKFNGIDVLVKASNTKSEIINQWFADKKVISDKWKQYEQLKQELGAE